MGICGLYAYKFAQKDAWLGWYGVIESERHKGYGSEILYFAIQQAKNADLKILGCTPMIKRIKILTYYIESLV